MHDYLRAIGFSEYKTKQQVFDLLNKIANNPDSRTSLEMSAMETSVEITHYFARDLGMIWHGTICDGEPDFDYFFPFYYGRHTYLREGFAVEKRINNDSYTGVIEDLRSGVSIIFYIINALDFAEWDEDGKIDYNHMPVALSALSTKGTIILPISMSDDDMRRKTEEQRHRTKLIAAARQGDEKAMESLTFEDMDIYTKISKRIENEDVFSIVSSCFMPYGLESDRYSIMGEIVEIDKTENIITGEKIWLLLIDYNGIVIDVAINEKDLVGEPKVGRRFKGVIWLQGRLDN